MSSPPCFSSNGTFLPAYGSCSDSNGNDVCCAAGQTCLSNGLCMTDGGGLYSGGCTDRLYISPTCPNFCITGTNHFIVSCNGSNTNTGTSGASGEYCCSGDGSLHCCSDDNSRLPLAAGSSTADAAFVIPVTLSTTTRASNPSSLPSTTAQLSSSPTLNAQVTPSPYIPPHQDLKSPGEIAALVVGLVLLAVVIIYGVLAILSGKLDLGLREWWAESRRKRNASQTTEPQGDSTAPTPGLNDTETTPSEPSTSIAVELDALKNAFERLNSPGNRPVELPTTTSPVQEHPPPGFYDGPADAETIQNDTTPNTPQPSTHQLADTWQSQAEWWSTLAQAEIDAADLEGRLPRPNTSIDAITSVREARIRLANLSSLPYSDPVMAKVTQMFDCLYPLHRFPAIPSDDAGAAGGENLPGWDNRASTNTNSPAIVVTPATDSSPANSQPGSGQGQERPAAPSTRWRMANPFIFRPNTLSLRTRGRLGLI